MANTMYEINDEVFVNGFFATIVELTCDCGDSYCQCESIAFVRDEDGAEHEIATDAIDGHIAQTVVANDFDANTKVGG